MKVNICLLFLLLRLRGDLVDSVCFSVAFGYKSMTIWKKREKMYCALYHRQVKWETQEREFEPEISVMSLLPLSSSPVACDQSLWARLLLSSHDTGPVENEKSHQKHSSGNVPRQESTICFLKLHPYCEPVSTFCSQACVSHSSHDTFFLSNLIMPFSQASYFVF